jgi:hypothetical protein
MIYGRPVYQPHPGRPHHFGIISFEDDQPVYTCPCGKRRDEAAVRRGRSAARLGKDQERAFEKEHGPRKIGEFGDPVDHIGAFGKYQVKSTRRPVTARLRHIDRMDAIYLDKVPILVERFVRRGVKTETFVTLRLRDWQALHGRDEA